MAEGVELPEDREDGEREDWRDPLDDEPRSRTASSSG